MSNNPLNQASSHLGKAKNYTIVLLKLGPAFSEDVANGMPIIWEHGKRNMKLREQGIMPIVCPIVDDKEFAGVGVLDTDLEEARSIMSDDPAVKAGVLTYSLHFGKGFPGDKLPL